jgi:photosystem II stability/assembly factor-like uncharacterized protein
VFRYGQPSGADGERNVVLIDIQTAAADGSSGYVYARTDGRAQVYGSADGGTTWNGIYNDEFDQTPSCPAFTVRPDGQGVGLCDNVFGYTIKTTYGGRDWKTLNSPFPVNDYHYLYPRVTAIAYLPDQPQTIFLGLYGITVTRDDTISWSNTGGGLPGISVDLQYNEPNASLFLMEHTGCTGIESLFHSTDLGRTWERLTDEGCGFAIYADGVTMHRFGYSTLSVSRDGGISWAAGARPTINASQIVSVATHPQLPEAAIAKIKVNTSRSTTSIEFFLTIDKGRTWQKQGEMTEISSNEDALYYSPVAGEVIYSIGAASNVARFQDGDDEWAACASVDAPSPTSASILAIHPNDTDRVYLATLGKGIQTSVDGCQSWRPVNEGLGSLFVNTIAINPHAPETIYAGTDGGAYISYDAGGTWGQVNDGLLGATVVYSIVVDQDSNVYAATPYGIFKLESK